MDTLFNRNFNNASSKTIVECLHSRHVPPTKQRNLEAGWNNWFYKPTKKRRSPNMIYIMARGQDKGYKTTHFWCFKKKTKCT